jgi:hypothetical protein
MDVRKRETEAVENEINRDMDILFFVLQFYITLTYSGTSGSGGKLWPRLVMLGKILMCRAELGRYCGC